MITYAGVAKPKYIFLICWVGKRYKTSVREETSSERGDLENLTREEPSTYLHSLILVRTFALFNITYVLPKGTCITKMRLEGASWEVDIHILMNVTLHGKRTLHMWLGISRWEDYPGFSGVKGRVITEAFSQGGSGL